MKNSSTGFILFVKQFTKVILRGHDPLSLYLRRFYLFFDTIAKSLFDPAALRSSARPFPAPPPFPIVGPPPKSGRRLMRFKLEKAMRMLCNLYVGTMSWLALGMPNRPPRGIGAEELPVLAETTLEAVETYRLDLDRLRRDSTFGSRPRGLSGGRAALFALLLCLPSFSDYQDRNLGDLSACVCFGTYFRMQILLSVDSI